MGQPRSPLPASRVEPYEVLVPRPMQRLARLVGQGPGQGQRESVATVENLWAAQSSSPSLGLSFPICEMSTSQTHPQPGTQTRESTVSILPPTPRQPRVHPAAGLSASAAWPPCRRCSPSVGCHEMRSWGPEDGRLLVLKRGGGAPFPGAWGVTRLQSGPWTAPC